MYKRLYYIVGKNKGMYQITLLSKFFFHNI